MSKRFLFVRRHVLLAAVSAISLAALVGCNRGPAMYQVSGHVFYKDGSVPRAAVAVVFLQPANNTTAEIKKGASRRDRS